MKKELATGGGGGGGVGGGIGDAVASDAIKRMQAEMESNKQKLEQMEHWEAQLKA